MSSIDNRIVRMQFDNEQFERGVMQSMRTLDELNEKLQFKEAGKGISALQVHLNNVNFDGIQNAIQHINHSFTSMTGMVAQRIKEDIVDNVINAAKRLEQVTLGQIKSGGKARAQNIANAKFMIEGLKYDWEQVKKAADYAVTDTAYGLDSAAKAASQLAASGVDFQETIETVNGTELTQMHKSLRAISGVAAMTNASYDEIAHIFTSVAGMGKLTAMQMNQLSLRGLNIASTIAQETGKTEQEIREMVSKGQISFQMFADAMDSAYGEHAKDANKTFQGSLSNLKAALSRIGAIFQQPVIDKTNTFFVSVTKRVKEFQAALNDTKALRVSEKGFKKLSEQASKAAKAAGLSGNAYDAFVKTQIESNKKLMLENKKSLENGDVEEYSISRFATHFAEAWEAAVNFASKVVETLDLSWFTSIGSFLDKAAIKATNFFGAASKAIDKVKASVDKTSASIADSLELDMNDLDLLHRILKNEFGYVEERWAKLDKIYKEQGSTKTGKWLQGYMDQLAGVGYSFEKLGWTEEEFKKKQEELAKTEAQRVSGMSKEELVIAELTGLILDTRSAMEGVRKTIGNVLKSIGNLGSAIGKVLLSFRSFSAGLHPDDLADRFARISEAIYRFTEVIQPSEEALQKIMEVSQDIGNVFDDVTEFVTNAVVAFIDFVASCLKANESLDDLAKNESLTSMQRAVLDVLRIINNLRRTFAALGTIVGKIFKSIKTAFQTVFGGEELGGALSAVTGGINVLSDGLATVVERVAEAEAPFKVIEHVFGLIFSIVHRISNILGDFTTGIRKVKNGIEDTEEVAGKAVDSGKKGVSFIENLGKVAGKGFKWVSELPGKLKVLWNTIKDQEGVKKLKTSIDNLRNTMKASISEGITPLSEGMAAFAEATGGEGESLVTKFADGVGKVADKISGFIDILPVWGQHIEDFFTRIKDAVTNAYDTISNSDFVKGIQGAFGSKDSLFNTVKEDGKSAIDYLKDRLASVDWKEVGDAGIFALTIGSLFKLWSALDGVTEAVKAFENIPSAISGVFTSLQKVFGSFGKAMIKITTSYQIGTIALSIAAMAGALYLLSTIDGTALSKAEAALLVIAGVLLAIAKFLDKISFMNAVKYTNVSDVLSGLASSLVKFAGLAIVITSLAYAVKQIGEVLYLFKEDGSVQAQAWMYLIATMAFIIAACATLALVIRKLPAPGSDALVEIATFAGFGILIMALGKAVKSIAEAVSIMDSIDTLSAGEAFWTAFGLIAVMTVAVIAITVATRALTVEQVFAVSALMLAISGGIALMCMAISAMAGVFALFGIVKKADALKNAFKYMMILMVVMAASIYIISQSFDDMGSARILGMIGSIAMMVVFVTAVAAALTKISALTGDQLTGAVISLVIVLGAIVAAFAILGSIAEGSTSGGPSTLMGVAIAFVAISASLYILAAALNAMSTVRFGTIALLAVAVLAMGAAIGILAKFVPADGLKAVAMAFIAFGGGVLLAGAGIYVMVMALKKLLPLIPVLLIDLDMFFKVLEDHWLIILLLTVAVIALAVAFGSMAAIVAPVVQGVVKVMTQASEIIFSLIKSVGSGLGKWFSELPTKGKRRIVTLIVTICGALLAAGPKVVETIGKMLIMILKYLSSIIGSIAYALLELLINLVNGLANAIRMHAHRILAAVYNVLLALVDVVIAALKLIINHLLGDAFGGKVADKLNDFLDKGQKKLDAKAQKALADAEAADAAAEANWNLAESVKDLNDAEDEYTKTHTDKSGSDHGGGGGSFDIVGAIKPKGNGSSDQSVTRLPGVPIEIPKGAVNAQGKSIGGQLGDGIADGVKGTVGKYMNTGELMPDMSDMTDPEGLGLVNPMDSVNEDIEDSAPELYKTTQTTVKEGPVDAIEDMEPEIRKSAREHINEILVDQVGDEGYRNMMETRMWSNGGYIMRGLAKGIDDHLYIVGDKMTQVTNLVNGNFIGPMKINSPSKLFYENGLYVLMGLAQGIDAGIPMVENASENMSSTIVDSFGAPLDYLSRIASGELVYDPTIRPVLDSSSIGRGAGAISSMFRNQNVSLSGFSGQLAADIGQLDSRNSDVVEELRALREEMSIMGEEISNMQVVMDTGALVGATAAPMDRALGRRVAYKGRGN